MSYFTLSQEFPQINYIRLLYSVFDYSSSVITWKAFIIIFSHEGLYFACHRNSPSKQIQSSVVSLFHHRAKAIVPTISNQQASQVSQCIIHHPPLNLLHNSWALTSPVTTTDESAPKIGSSGPLFVRLVVQCVTTLKNRDDFDLANTAPAEGIT